MQGKAAMPKRGKISVEASHICQSSANKQPSIKKKQGYSNVKAKDSEARQIRAKARQRQGKAVEWKPESKAANRRRRIENYAHDMGN